jgi:hypothetical protein
MTVLLHTVYISSATMYGPVEYHTSAFCRCTVRPLHHRPARLRSSRRPPRLPLPSRSPSKLQVGQRLTESALKLYWSLSCAQISSATYVCDTTASWAVQAVYYCTTPLGTLSP